MRLSPTTGKGLLGIGTIQISIDGVVPPALASGTGGGWAWLSDTLCGGQLQGLVPGGFRLYQFNTVSNVASILDPVYHGGSDVAQAFCAGNGNWARQLGGVFTSSGLGLTLPSAGLMDIDAQGRLLVVANASADSGLASYDASGHLLVTVPVKTFSAARAKDGVVTNRNTSGEWHLRNMLTGAPLPFAPRTDEIVVGMVPVQVGGGVWVVELTGTRLTIRPATSGSGYVLATSPNIFGPDALSMAANTVRVGWAVTTGEGPTHYRRADLTLDTGALTLGSSATGALVTTPQAPLSLTTFPTGAIGGTGSSILLQPTPTQKNAEIAKLAGARKPKRQYPHVPDVADPHAQKTLRLLWDRVFDMDEQLNGTKPSALQTSTAAVSSELASFQSSQTLALQQLSAATTGTPLVVHSFPGGGGSGSGGGGGGGSGGGGGGGQSSDCAGAPATGHIPAGDLTFDRALQIICGTSTEWGGLTSSTLDLATREANAEELIRRMIWHLALGGFTAGRQRNPSTAISKDKLAVVILGETRAFDVFRSFDSFNKTMVVQMNEVFPADLVADSGISD